MDEPLQVSIQLPAGALGQLAQLLEQARYLLQSSSRESVAASEESLASPSFNTARFQQLQQLQREVPNREPVMPAKRAMPPENAPLGEPEAVGAVISDVTPAALPVREEVREDLPAARADTIGNPQEQPRAEAVQAPAFAEMDEIPVASDLPADTEAEANVVQTIPTDNTPEADVVHQEVTKVEAAASVSADAGSALPAPLSGRWDGLREELKAAGPAPLTAEAVSLAFRRDDRRYDRGFPLY